MKRFKQLFAVVVATILVATSCENSDANVTIDASDERQVLIDLYDSTNGENWTISTNWYTDAPLEEWYGIITDSSGGIKEINLSNNQLEGSIPSTIGSLSNLEVMNLSNNELSSSIPSTIGSLSNLETMNLSNNGLSSSIPSTIESMSSLEIMDLSNNALSSSIPSTIGNLSSLVEVNLSNNELASSIPSAIGNLSNMEVLNLSSNLLNSEIPTEIGGLISLEYLNLGDNQLEGSIPESIGNLTNLLVLDLSYNTISGDVPESLANLVNLTELYLQETDLTGEIPQSLIDQGVTVVVDLELVIPTDLVGEMANYMPIYEGVNPPNVEGWFLMDDMTVVYCEDYGSGGFAPGYNYFVDQYFEFFDQDYTYLTLMTNIQSSLSTGAGEGSFIRGEGNNFTAYFDISGITYGSYSNEIVTKQATVISGTLTDTGITDMYYAFVLVSKDDDIYDDLMDEGIYRVFYEGDGLATRVSSASSATTKSGQIYDELQHSILGRIK